MNNKEDLFETIAAITGGYRPPVIPEFIKNIDWKLLREQKATLVYIIYSKRDADPINKDLNGILHLIDALQDFSVDVMGLTDKEVFDLVPEDDE